MNVDEILLGSGLGLAAADPVQGSHDMYRAGEYMIFTDGKTYRYKIDTNFSPTDYTQAWEIVN